MSLSGVGGINERVESSLRKEEGMLMNHTMKKTLFSIRRLWFLPSVNGFVCAVCVCVCGGFRGFGPFYGDFLPPVSELVTKKSPHTSGWEIRTLSPIGTGEFRKEIC